MKLIGLTGGLGSGKSTVSEILRGEGLDVLDADVFAREVVTPGSFGLLAIVQTFGPDLLKGQELDRPLLAEKIFSDVEARTVTERILHPLIQWRARAEIQRLQRDGKALIFYDAALLFEKDMTHQFDDIVVVHTSRETQLQRIMARDKIAKDVAEKRLEAQWPIEKKKAGAKNLVDNGGTREETRSQVLAIVQKLME